MFPKSVKIWIKLHFTDECNFNIFRKLVEIIYNYLKFILKKGKLIY